MSRQISRVLSIARVCRLVLAPVKQSKKSHRQNLKSLITKVIRLTYEEFAKRDDTALILSLSEAQLRERGGTYNIGDDTGRLSTGAGGAIMYRQALLKELAKPVTQE